MLLIYRRIGIWKKNERSHEVTCRRDTCPGHVASCDMRTNFLSITCCAIKGKEIRYFVTNCRLAQLVGLSRAELLVLESGSSNPEGFPFFFFFF